MATCFYQNYVIIVLSSRVRVNICVRHLPAEFLLLSYLSTFRCSRSYATIYDLLSEVRKIFSIYTKKTDTTEKITVEKQAKWGIQGCINCICRRYVVRSWWRCRCKLARNLLSFIFNLPGLSLKNYLRFLIFYVTYTDLSIILFFLFNLKINVSFAILKIFLCF